MVLCPWGRWKWSGSLPILARTDCPARLPGWLMSGEPCLKRTSPKRPRLDSGLWHLLHVTPIALSHFPSSPVCLHTTNCPTKAEIPMKNNKKKTNTSVLMWIYAKNKFIPHCFNAWHSYSQATVQSNYTEHNLCCYSLYVLWWNRVHYKRTCLSVVWHFSEALGHCASRPRSYSVQSSTEV